MDVGDFPVRDMTALTDPLVKGYLIGDIVTVVQQDTGWVGGEIPSFRHQMMMVVVSLPSETARSTTVSNTPPLVHSTS